MWFHYAALAGLKLLGSMNSPRYHLFSCESDWQIDKHFLQNKWSLPVTLRTTDTICYKDIIELSSEN